MKLPPNTEPGLVATHFWEPPNFTFPFGAHIVVTEVDRDTGEIAIKRYVAVDDCGNILNPLIVDGQVHGGVAQGLGQALWEQAVYDDNGQLVTGELMDYALPKAHMMPWIETSHTITPSPVNPLGVKGVGEAGTIGCSPAVVNSVVDALQPLGVRHIDMPMTPEKIWNLIQAGGQRMIPQTFEYSAPANLDEALELLGDGEPKPLAGGMSLIPMMKLRLATPDQLVDIGRIKDLNYIREEGDVMHIGATTTHYEVAKLRAAAGQVPAAGGDRRRTSAICRCATAAPSAAASRMPIRRPIIRRRCRRSKLGSFWSARNRSAKSRSPISSSTRSPPRSNRARSSAK